MNGKEGNYVIPNNVQFIGGCAFYGCKKLTNIEISNNVTWVGSSAFEACKGLKNIVIPDDCEVDLWTSSTRLFKDCTELQNVKLSNNITTIGWSFFYNCTNLTNIIIPKSVYDIRNQAFGNCENLTKVVIPKEVMNIDDYAFENCNNLTIYCNSNTTAHRYAETYTIPYVIDDTAPTIKLQQEGQYIKIIATDNQADLGDNPYSLDGKNWQESSEIPITENKEYTIYVRDALGNTASAKITPDLNKPIIENVTVNKNKISVTAKDTESELAEKPYSKDNKNWQASNEITVDKSGIYTVYVKDNAGNIAQEDNIMVDIDAPNITKCDVNVNKITIIATDNLSGLADKPYSINGKNWQESNVITVNEVGKYTVYVKDKKENIATKEVNVDVEAPNIKEVKYENGKVTIIAEDAKYGLAEKAYSVNQKDWQKENEFTVSKEGIYTVYVRNVYNKISSKSVIADKTAPVILSVKNNKGIITIEAKDNETQLADKAYSIDDGQTWQANNVFKVTKTGEYTISVKDLNGNIAKTKIMIDLDAPIILNVSVKDDKTIVINAKDENSGLADKPYSIDGKNWQEPNSFTVEKSGRYVVYVKDKEDNIATQLVVIENKVVSDDNSNNGNNSNGGNNEKNPGNNNDKNNNISSDKDNTQIDKEIPQAGKNSIIVAILVVSVIGIIGYKKYKKNNIF